MSDKELDLAQKRAQLWKKALQENLLKPADKFDVKVGMPTDRGSITQIVVEITK
jgi:prophage tail gpP-like protein